MLSGRSGTAKSLFASFFAQAAAKKGKKVLFVSFEETPDDIIANTQSVGINLKTYIKKNKLFLHSLRPVEMGLEDIIIHITDLTQKHNIDALVIDPISSLLDMGSDMEVKMLFIRFINFMKSRGLTLYFTELISDAAQGYSRIGLSSLTDTWVRLTNVENNGEFNRLLYISKSRGSKTSNQM